MAKSGLRALARPRLLTPIFAVFGIALFLAGTRSHRRSTPPKRVAATTLTQAAGDAEEVEFPIPGDEKPRIEPREWKPRHRVRGYWFEKRTVRGGDAHHPLGEEELTLRD